ncbi:hypothetical protein JTF06_02145 [Desemzia sp. RIT804]|uniref:hypothetical protein n=1 Tax=Desemzia sp. RIT 804 TaxID=2810209 RepID=UPI001951F87B|nr:hypothetical protein [Desemzia sp. RIT 804]MBM6613693.1 hypothetical protein [Desemzia sp. RIT 804]
MKQLETQDKLFCTKEVKGMKWQFSDSCGNSPKNQMLVDWMKKFVDGKDCSDFIKEYSVIQIGNKELPMEKYKFPDTIEKIQIETAISHGKSGAIRGQAMTQNSTINFALFFEFTLGKRPRLIKTTCIYQ